MWCVKHLSRDWAGRQEGSHFSRTHCKQVLATSQWNSTQPPQKNYCQETPCIRDEKGSKGRSILRKSWYILIGCGEAWNPLARRQCLTGKRGVPLDPKHAPEQHLLRHLWLHVATPCDAFSCTIRTNIDTHLLDRLYPTELLCGVCESESNIKDDKSNMPSVSVKVLGAMGWFSLIANGHSSWRKRISSKALWCLFGGQASIREDDRNWY